MSTTISGNARPKAEPAESLLHALEAAAATDRMCNTHEAVRLELMAALLRANLHPTTSAIADVSCTTPNGEFLYEVLGAGRSSYADLRLGAARVLEINHTVATSTKRLHLVLSEPPTEDWSVETIHDIFWVHVLWRTPEGWGGPEAKTATTGVG